VNVKKIAEAVCLLEVTILVLCFMSRSPAWAEYTEWGPYRVNQFSLESDCRNTPHDFPCKKCQTLALSTNAFKMCLGTLYYGDVVGGRPVNSHIACEFKVKKVAVSHPDPKKKVLGQIRISFHFGVRYSDPCSWKNIGYVPFTIGKGKKQLPPGKYHLFMAEAYYGIIAIANGKVTLDDSNLAAMDVTREGILEADHYPFPKIKTKTKGSYTLLWYFSDQILSEETWKDWSTLRVLHGKRVRITGGERIHSKQWKKGKDQFIDVTEIWDLSSGKPKLVPIKRWQGE